MVYYKAWYRKSSDSGSRDVNYPDWVVFAQDEADAEAKVLQSIGRREPEKGCAIFLTPINDEDEATVAFATARQNGQALS